MDYIGSEGVVRVSDVVLQLKADEEVMINGVIVQNEGDETELRVLSPGVRFLRMENAIRPDEATTPVKKAYYIAQLGAGGALDADEARRILEGAFVDLERTYSEKNEAVLIEQASYDLKRGGFHEVLRKLALIMQFESDESVSGPHL